MTADALKKITTDALDKLAGLLDEGHSDQLTALLKTMARFHKYSWHNVCLIASQRPEVTRVAGYQTWRTMGRFVRKGEKGIAIMAPIVGRREAEAEHIGGSVVDHQFEFGRLLYRQISWLGALENAVDVPRRMAEFFGAIRAAS